jgi:TrmH family RNA methyltransferase
MGRFFGIVKVMKLRRSGGGTKRRTNKGPRDLGMKYGSDARRKSDKASGGIVSGKPAKGPAFGRARIPVSETFKKKTGAQKMIESLQNKKERDARKLFLVEGDKSFMEAVQSTYELNMMFATHAFLATYPEIADFAKGKINIVDNLELSGMGNFASNTMVIGVFHQKPLPPLVVADEVILALSDINDPGNLGTILRIADWYGIKKIVASKNTVDMYNPKVISASKGSFSRVAVYYQDLEDFFRKLDNLPVFAADLEGQSVHTTQFPSRGALLLGSESHGIDRNLEEFITKQITIPRFGDAESLNVAVAGAVILDSWRRN